MNALIVLNEVRLLWNHLHTYVEGIGATNYAQHNLGGVDVVVILREAAQVIILVRIDVGNAELMQIAIP